VSASEHAKEVVVLVKKLRGEYASALEPVETTTPIDRDEPLLGEFIRSFMMWEATSAKAASVLGRIESSVVDFNELRICLPDELVRIMGERYPRVEERALRLRAALNEIYHRQHAVTLEPLATMGKREAKDYLDSLDGVPRFVASRVFLLCMGGHAAPVDGRIAKRLVESDVAEPGATPEAAAASLERKVRAGELGDVYKLLQAWADDAPLNYSETPAETPKRREGKGMAPSHHHHPEPLKKKAGKGTSAKDGAKKKSAG
jgi:hypothetical protein